MAGGEERNGGGERMSEGERKRSTIYRMNADREGQHIHVVDSTFKSNQYLFLAQRVGKLVRMTKMEGH